jgi:SAM-dependent methyltransferase
VPPGVPLGALRVAGEDAAGACAAAVSALNSVCGCAAGAGRLPFDDATIDTVVSTLVLCTVDAPDVALREIGRVLGPDGQLLFLEHVRSDSPTLALVIGRATSGVVTRPGPSGPSRPGSRVAVTGSAV